MTRKTISLNEKIYNKAKRDGEKLGLSIGAYVGMLIWCGVGEKNTSQPEKPVFRKVSKAMRDARANEMMMATTPEEEAEINEKYGFVEGLGWVGEPKVNY